MALVWTVWARALSQRRRLSSSLVASHSGVWHLLDLCTYWLFAPCVMYGSGVWRLVPRWDSLASAPAQLNSFSGVWHLLLFGLTGSLLWLEKRTGVWHLLLCGLTGSLLKFSAGSGFWHLLPLGTHWLLHSGSS